MYLEKILLLCMAHIIHLIYIYIYYVIRDNPVIPIIYGRDMGDSAESAIHIQAWVPSLDQKHGCQHHSRLVSMDPTYLKVFQIISAPEG